MKIYVFNYRTKLWMRDLEEGVDELNKAKNSNDKQNAAEDLQQSIDDL